MPGTQGAFKAGVRRGALRKEWRRVVVLGLLLPAACAAPPAAPPGAEMPAIPPASVAAPAAPAASAVALPAVPVSAAPGGLGRLGSARGVELAALLGRPDFLRRDGPAEVWQYRTRSCVLDFFLYDEPDGQRVAHAEARNRAGAAMTARRCLDALAGSRGGTVASQL
jgi:hypothetical protein